MTPITLAAPVAIAAAHEASRFDCREPILDEWLEKRSLRNEASGASRTYVVCADTIVVG